MIPLCKVPLQRSQGPWLLCPTNCARSKLLATRLRLYVAPFTAASSLRVWRLISWARSMSPARTARKSLRARHLSTLQKPARPETRTKIAIKHGQHTTMSAPERTQPRTAGHRPGTATIARVNSCLSCSGERGLDDWAAAMASREKIACSSSPWIDYCDNQRLSN